MKNNETIYILMEVLIFYKYIIIYNDEKIGFGDSMEIVKKIDNTIKILKNNTSEDCIQKDKLYKTEKEINKITKMMEEAVKKTKEYKEMLKKREEIELNIKEYEKINGGKLIENYFKNNKF